jgi:ribose transport system substrate-binding protein
MSRTMKLPRLLGWLAAGLLLAVTMGCQQGPSRTRVAFVTNNPETFWTFAEKGCAKAEKEFGVEVIFYKPPDGDAANQTMKIDDLVNQDIKAIAVSVINPKGQSAHLKEVAAKLPLITQDNDAPDCGRVCYLGTNNYKAGRAVGQLIKEVLPDGGVLAVFVGQTEPLNARQRRQGMLDELAGKPEPKEINDIEYGPDGQMYGKYRLYRTYTDQPIGSQKATENASDALTDLADEKNLCFIGLWAYNPPAILSAVRDKGKLGQVKIVGFDENEATVQGVLDGHIYGTVVQNPFDFGYHAVRIMASLTKGDRSVLPKDGILYFPHRVVTKDGGKDRLTAAAFQKEIRALLSN